MRFFKFVPALLAGAMVLCLSPSVQAQYDVKITITDISNPSDEGLTKTVASGSSATLNFNGAFGDGGSTFTITPTLTVSSSGDVLSSAVTATTGTNGDSYLVTSSLVPTGSAPLTNLSGPGKLTTTISTGSTFVSGDMINNNGSYVPTSGTGVSAGTIFLEGPSSSATKMKPIGSISSFVLSESSVFNANSTGTTDKWVASVKVTPLVVPEPAGVLIGLVGLPCLGAVVFFSRRRLSGMSTLVA